eukprot:SAG31_NODE_32919_length_350_cov_0.792829_1_plen_68_part_10
MQQSDIVSTHLVIHTCTRYLHNATIRLHILKIRLAVHRSTMRICVFDTRIQIQTFYSCMLSMEMDIRI